MKSLFPVFAILLGLIFSQAYRYAFLIQYFLMFILFFPFLNLQINKFYKNTWWIVLANILIAFIVYLCVVPFNSTLAFIAFITAITPTATAAPAIISFLKGNVEYVTFSVILTNCIVALIVPFIIPILIHQGQPINTQEVFHSILSLFLIPYFVAQLIKLISPNLQKAIVNHKNISFYAWNILLFIASAKATHFIFSESKTPPAMIFAIALSSLLVCIINFVVGHFIGGERFAKEASQSLGQKNTMFTVWLSLSFLQPIVALGPMFYLLYHNLYNSYQLVQMNHKLQNGHKQA
ncbi:MAG TPA: hypothetical protein V6C85_08550 [Allocoleopsis sp.]